QAGADFLVQEICQTSDPTVEVVVLADPDPNSKSEIKNPKQTQNPISEIGDPKGDQAISDFGFRISDSGAAMALAFERTLDVDRFPFLKSHVIGGKAVLPLAMSMEWLAHAALHGNPGMTFHGFDTIRVLHGVILDEESSCTIRVLAGKPIQEGLLTRVPVELRSTQEVGKKHSREADTLHVRGDVILAARLPAPGSQIP